MTQVISSETRDHLPSTQDGVNLPQYPIGLASADLGLAMKKPSRVTEAKFPKPEGVLGGRRVQLKGRGMGSPTLPVHSEVLKPEDVQEANGPPRVLHFQGGRLVDCCVDLLHNPHKETPIDALKGTR